MERPTRVSVQIWIIRQVGVPISSRYGEKNEKNYLDFLINATSSSLLGSIVSGNTPISSIAAWYEDSVKVRLQPPRNEALGSIGSELELSIWRLPCWASTARNRSFRSFLNDLGELFTSTPSSLSRCLLRFYRFMGSYSMWTESCIFFWPIDVRHASLPPAPRPGVERSCD